MSINIFIFFLCCLLTKVFALFDLCNHKIDMKPFEKLYINSPYYPAEYPIGSSCRYMIKAPQDYKLKLSCDIKLNTPPLATNCQNEIFYFNGEGSEILTGSEYFCGTGKMERKSFLNQAVLSYISTANNKRIQTKTNTLKIDEDEEKTITSSQKTENKTGKKRQKIKITATTTSKLLKEHQLTTETATIAKPTTRTTTEPIATKKHLLTTTSFTTPLPTLPSSKAEVNMKKAKDAIEKDKKVNNLFAYVVTLLSHKIDKEAFAAAASNCDKLLKRNTTITKTTTTTTTTLTRPISVLKFNELLPASMWHNDSKATTKISTKRVAKVIVGQDYTTSTTATLSNSSSPPDNHRSKAAGGGSFSCLIEVIQPPCECGWGSTVKIAGASGVAGVDEFPSMAGIMTIKNRKIFCGATIIHHRYLLSAAHCYLATDTGTAEYLTAVVGEHDLSTVMDSFYTRQYDLIKIIRHEKFRASSYHAHHDIALLKTRYAIEWNRSVGPVCLPFFSLKTSNRQATPHTGQRVETAGWGTTSFGGQQSSLLLKTTLDVIAYSSCQHIIGSLPQGVFCTYTPGRDTCQYDSGGALHVRLERLFAVGIVSYGFACATKQPSVNTRISSYLQWITNKTPDAKYCIR